MTHENGLQQEIPAAARRSERCAEKSLQRGPVRLQQGQDFLRPLAPAGALVNAGFVPRQEDRNIRTRQSADRDVVVGVPPRLHAQIGHPRLLLQKRALLHKSREGFIL